MNNKKYSYIISALCMLLLTSGCAMKSESEAPDAQPSETNQDNTTKVEDALADSGNEILIVIDQTPKPIEGNSFDFVVKQVPEGFALAEIQWISKDNLIVNSVQDAIEHGANGEDGFYISGDGQFSGFIYPDTMKGEEGQVVFLFKDSEGNELTWKKKLTLSPSANSQEGGKNENAIGIPQDALEQYMQAIANQDAAKLVELYGGSYQGLINLFPETDTSDKLKLIDQYLKLLPRISLNEILEQTVVSKDEYIFVITLKLEDGTLFHTREFDTTTEKFTYTVKRVDGKLKMMELPPYQA